METYSGLADALAIAERRALEESTEPLALRAARLAAETAELASKTARAVGVIEQRLEQHGVPAPWAKVKERAEKERAEATSAALEAMEAIRKRATEQALKAAGMDHFLPIAAAIAEEITLGELEALLRIGHEE